MKCVIFGGTTEGRTLSECLSRQGIPVEVRVATSYGRALQGSGPNQTVRGGRLSEEEMCEVLRDAFCVVDATHPYAAEARQNIRRAAEKTGVPYLRFTRRESVLPADCLTVSSAAEAANYLQNRTGAVFLATGVKELPNFSILPGKRLYPRVLPMIESLSACEAAGIPAKNIIAMQGPFTEEVNAALFLQYHIRYLITKDGGREGGFPEKAAAAEKTGVTMLVIRRPKESADACYELEEAKQQVMALFCGDA